MHITEPKVSNMPFSLTFGYISYEIATDVPFFACYLGYLAIHNKLRAS